MLFVDI